MTIGSCRRDATLRARHVNMQSLRVDVQTGIDRRFRDSMDHGSAATLRRVPITRLLSDLALNGSAPIRFDPRDPKRGAGG